MVPRILLFLLLLVIVIGLFQSMPQIRGREQEQSMPQTRGREQERKTATAGLGGVRN